jgi:DNA-binding ferritin-like protein
MLVGRWRARAQEVLAQAETMRDAEARQMMQEIAARYERLAQQVEQQTGRTDKV